jgi:hypothetical protein
VVNSSRKRKVGTNTEGKEEKVAATRRGGGNKGNPPSYSAQKTTTGLKKKKVAESSQLMSQVLNRVIGNTETTGSDLPRMLSQSSKVKLDLTIPDLTYVD